jgi:hypothetical protein
MSYYLLHSLYSLFLYYYFSLSLILIYMYFYYSFLYSFQDKNIFFRAFILCTKCQNRDYNAPIFPKVIFWQRHDHPNSCDDTHSLSLLETYTLYAFSLWELWTLETKQKPNRVIVLSLTNHFSKLYNCFIAKLIWCPLVYCLYCI